MSAPRQHGFSLVEIMVALAVGLFLTAGVVQIYISNKQSYRVAEGSARIQENARFAAEFLARDLRMAGYLGCSTDDMLRTVENTVSSTNYADRFDIAIEGFEANESGWTPSLDSSMSGALTGRDAITIRGAFDDGAAITGVDTANLTFELDPDSAGRLVGVDTAVASNCGFAWIHVVEIDGDSAAPVNADAQSFVNFPNDSNSNNELLPVETRSYYIGQREGASVPSLYRRIGSDPAQELIEGVGDMQIWYGRDTDDDDTVDDFDTADELSSDDWEEVVSVRVCLAFVSVEDNLTLTSDATPPCGGVALDGDRMRRVVASTISLRNRLP